MSTVILLDSKCSKNPNQFCLAEKIVFEKLNTMYKLTYIIIYYSQATIDVLLWVFCRYTDSDFSNCSDGE